MLKSLTSRKMSRFRPAVFSLHLAEGIDRLQSDLNPVPESYMCFLFPTLVQLQHVYEQLSNSRPNGLKFCMPFSSAILADMCFSHCLVFSNSIQTQSAALASMTHPVFKLRWIKPANLEQMRNLFLKSLRFLSAMENQQDATKSGRFDGVVDYKTLDFFTSITDSDGDSRTTLQSQAEGLQIQYLEDSDRTLSFFERYPLYVQKI